MDNFFTGSRSNDNFSRNFSKGKSFQFSGIWNETTTYNNDAFIQDFVVWEEKLWGCMFHTSTNNRPGNSDHWQLILEGVSNIVFDQDGNKIVWRYEDESTWRELIELDVVSESEIKNMLAELDVKLGNTYDKELDVNSTNAVQNKAVAEAISNTSIEIDNVKKTLTSKQNTISDIDQIRNKANSALQKIPEEYVTESELSNSITVSEELTNNKIVSLDTKKVDKVSGKGLSTNDFTNNFKTKLEGLSNYNDSEVKNLIASETNRAKSVEQVLTDAIITINGTGTGSIKKTVTDEIAKVIDSAPAAFDTLKEIADYINEDQEAAAVIANDLVEHSNAIEENKSEIVAISKNVTELSEEKADKNGKYADLTAGDLYGHGESVPAEFTFRATGGKSIKDGSATIKELQGNAVVWNNMVDTRNYEEGFAIRDGIHIIQGHKYLLQRTIAEKGTIYLIPVIDGNEYYEMSLHAGEYAGIFQSQYTAKEDAVVYAEGKCGACVISDLTKMYGAGNEPTTIEEYNARKPIVADEYAYNEGEVIAFNGDAVKSVGDNAFNGVWYQGRVNENSGQPSVGSLSDIYTDTFRVIGGETYCSQFDGADLYLKGYFFDKSGAFIGSSDFDVWQGAKQWVAPINAYSVRMRIYNAVGNITPSQAPNVMIRLDHSGWKSDIGVGYEPYWADTLQIDSRIKAEFPNGMMPWDKVYNKDGKGYIVKGTGAVDLGDLEWKIIDFNGNEAFLSQYNNLGAQYVDHITHVCDRYFPVTHEIYTAGEDMAIALNNGYYSNIANRDHIVIRDTRYTDAASFKAMLQEKQVILYYELAEPTIIEYDKPFKLDYKVADFGTEELISAQPSAPFKARTIYQFNAVDQIRENAVAIEELKKNGGGGYDDTELRNQIASKVDATYVSNAINSALGTIINGDY